MKRINWTTTEGCPRCWEYGPYLPGPDENGRDAHQAAHEIAAVILVPITRLLDAVKDACTPVGQSEGERE